MYYALVITAAVLFGLQFFFNKLYQRQNGSDLRSATIFALGTSLVCAAAMLCIQKFRIEFSAYSFCLAVLSAIILIAYIFCSIKAMEKISLSLYTMFGMLGGMVLPFLVGVFGYGEELTAKKILSAVLVLFALTIGTDYKAGGKAIFYGIAVFFLNGFLFRVFHSRLQKFATHRRRVFHGKRDGKLRLCKRFGNRRQHTCEHLCIEIELHL